MGGGASKRAKQDKAEIEALRKKVAEQEAAASGHGATPVHSEAAGATADGPTGQRPSAPGDVRPAGAGNASEAPPRPVAKKIRRGEVSAEVMAAMGASAAYQKRVVPKDDRVRDLCSTQVSSSILFQGLGREEKADCVDAFFRVESAAGEVVIQQGDQGDNFYVVESGTLDIILAKGDEPPATVGQVSDGAAFGELALMYNTPRAATIKAVTTCVLWALDRGTYRTITQHYQALRKAAYMEFLRNVPILQSLSERELGQMATGMEEEIFEPDEVIIRQGEIGDHFYIISEGTVAVLKSEDGEPEVEVAQLGGGHYFGERALLSEDTRAATCKAVTETVCLTMGRSNFNEMLGSLQDLIERAKNPTAALADESATAVISESQYHVDLGLDELEIKSTLGCGAFGRVKLVKHRVTGTTYALKCLIKHDIVENNLQEHVINERNVMLQLDHPFILKLHNTFKDSTHVYFLLELLLGGELFTYLRKAGRFNEKAARFYAASVVQAFGHIHSKSIVYRDLKPENLILNSQGFLKVVDFGLAKTVTDRTWTLCGTPDYLAPEIILSKGHDKAVDYWALGVLIYEMCAGFVPFYSDDPMEVYQLILAGDLRCPSQFSRACTDLVQKLMNANQSKRLGNMKHGIRDITKHKWFSGFDWSALLDMTLRPPIVPVVHSEEDISNFDEYPEDEEPVPVSDWSPEF